jgi:hypothetical protein
VYEGMSSHVFVGAGVKSEIFLKLVIDIKLHTKFSFGQGVQRMSVTIWSQVRFRCYQDP